MLLEQLKHPTPTLALGALLHDVGKPPTFRVAERIRFDGHVEEGVRMAHDILSRLRFSRDEMEQVEALVANHMRFKDVQQMKESTLKRFLRLPAFRGAPGAAPAGLPVEQQAAGELRVGQGEVWGSFRKSI